MSFFTKSLSWSPIASACTAAAGGVATHIFVFRHGDYHLKVPLILQLFLATSFSIFFCTLQMDSTKGADWIQRAATNTFYILMIYLVFLTASIVVYRTIFHQLHDFPGPFMARVTKLWHFGKGLNISNHLLLDQLHEQYGDFVRTGPNEITIFAPEAVLAMDGPGTKCTKAVWYDFLLPYQSIQTTRIKSMHNQRRRVWDHSYSTKALREHEKTVIMYAQQLHKGIAASSGTPVDASQWFSGFSFDVMGDLTLNKSFRMLETEEWHDIPRMLRKALVLLGLFSPVPWLFRLLFSMRALAREWNQSIAWCSARMQERIEMEVEKPDVSSWLINASKKTGGTKSDHHWLVGDAIVMIIAGSDTLASALVFTFYQLASSPAQTETLYQELQTLDSLTDAHALQSLGYLNGFINEALRLYPPIPTGGLRVTPPQGITVAGKYIPGGTTIGSSRWAIGRLESCYERADEFIPERWLPESQMIKNKTAFSPFSLGIHSCVGKTLALMEMRVVIALLVGHFRISFAEGTDPDAVVGKMRDNFTASPGKLELVFTPRTGW